MKPLTARLLFRLEHAEKNSIESTSEEIIPLLTNNISIDLNVGSLFFFGEVEYIVKKIETHISEKTDKVFGMSYAEKIGESYPYSISITYIINETNK